MFGQHRPGTHTLAGVVVALMAAACATAPVVVEEPVQTREPAVVQEPPIRTGNDLLDRMRNRWGPHWYESLSFAQDNTLYLTTGSEQTSEWRQRIVVPGKLRVDYLPLANRSGVLYERGRVHVFDNGRELTSERGTNPLLLLTSDVFVRPPGESAAALDTLGVDLSTIHGSRWEGRPAWVVGAAPGDTLSTQFWVDAERLVLLRLIQGQGSGPAASASEVRIARYTTVDGVPVPGEVLRLRGGRVVFREQYRDFRLNEPIAAELFDPRRWTEAYAGSGR